MGVTYEKYGEPDGQLDGTGVKASTWRKDPKSTMKRYPALAFVLLLALLSPLRADDLKAAPPKGLRVFTTGHSFHYFIPGILDEAAKGGGIADHKIAGTQAIGGSRVIQHWEAPAEKNKVKPALESGEVDVLTMSPIYLPDEGIEKLTAYALEKNPNIRVTLQEFWMPYDDQALWPKGTPEPIDRDAKTIEQLRTAHAPYFKSMDEHVTALNEKFGKQVILVVPVGQAVLALREKIVAGQVPGIAKQSELFTDKLGHVGGAVMVLNAYCHYAVIYGRSPVGLPVSKALAKEKDPAGLTPVLQQLAWDAVQAHPLAKVKS